MSDDERWYTADANNAAAPLLSVPRWRQDFRCSFMKRCRELLQHKHIKYVLCSSLFFILGIVTFVLFVPKFVDQSDAKYVDTERDLKVEESIGRAKCAQATFEGRIHLQDDTASKCLGPPYLYITFHGGKGPDRIRTVCKYTRDGCSLGTAILPSYEHSPMLLRDIVLLGPKLIVADAWKHKSRLLIYGKCNENYFNSRELERVVEVTDIDRDLLIHPYGFAVDPKHPEYLYVSVQGTTKILRYKFVLKPSTSEQDSHLVENLVFDRVIFDLDGDPIRGIAFNNQSQLYFANKKKGVQVTTWNGGETSIPDLYINKPISVYYDTEANTLWVGSKHGNVYEVDLSSMSYNKIISYEQLQHPAGFVTYGSSIFIISQDSNKLLEFSKETGEFVRIVLPTLPEEGERIILGPC